MPPAVGTPWLVTLRSTTNRTSPTITSATPIMGRITIVNKAPSIRSLDMPVAVASSVRSDCIAPHHHGFLRTFTLVELHDDLLYAMRDDCVGVKWCTYPFLVDLSLMTCTFFLTTMSSKRLLETSSS